jgi:hypothetical protein
MRRLKRVFAGILNLGLGVGAIWFAVAAYRAGRDLAPLTGELRGQDYAVIFALGGLGVVYLAIAYVFLVPSRRA